MEAAAMAVRRIAAGVLTRDGPKLGGGGAVAGGGARVGFGAEESTGRGQSGSREGTGPTHQNFW